MDIDTICSFMHIVTMWIIEYTQEFEDWFSVQEEESKIAINAKVIVLSEFGPQLGRPYVDTIHGSKYPNLKELRVKCKNDVFRILFLFNKSRNCWLIIGGNKKGKNEEDFYKKLIKQAEELIERNSEVLEGENA